MANIRPTARYSLKSILILLFGGLLIITTILLSWVLTSIARNSLLSEQKIAMEALATQAANRFDNNLAERVRELRTVASIRRAGGLLLQNKGQARAWLNNLRTSYPLYAWIGYADTKGEVQVSSGGLLEGASVAERPWFKAGLEGVFIGDVHKALLLESLLTPRDNPWRFLDVSLPVTNADGDVVGVLGAHLSDDWFTLISNDVLKATLRYKPVEAILLDKDGEIVMAPEGFQDAKALHELAPPRDALAPVSKVASLNGESDYLMAFLAPSQHPNLQMLDWMLVVRQPRGVAFEGILELQDTVLQVGLLLLLASIFLAVGFSVWISRPLRSAAAGAQRFTETREVPDILEARYLEGAELLQSLKVLMTDIREYENELEDKVEQRTEELANSLKQIEINERQLRTITDNLPVQIAYIDVSLRHVFYNSAYETALGLADDSALWKPLQEILPEERYLLFLPYIEQALAGNRAKFEFPQLIEGKPRILECQYIPDIAAGGEVSGFFVMMSDITDLREQHQRLQWQVQHDSLTGALNRQGLQVILELALERAFRYRSGMALMFIDLDRFKAVNDTYGHAVGDEVLKATVQRTREVLRKSDSVARIAGDEFVVVLENLQEPERNATQVARSILDSLNEPLQVGTADLRIQGSIGVACLDGQYRVDKEELLKLADEAMYESKNAGRNQYRILTLSKPLERESDAEKR